MLHSQVCNISNLLGILHSCSTTSWAFTNNQGKKPKLQLSLEGPAARLTDPSLNCVLFRIQRDPSANAWQHPSLGFNAQQYQYNTWYATPPQSAGTGSDTTPTAEVSLQHQQQQNALSSSAPSALNADQPTLPPLPSDEPPLPSENYGMPPLPADEPPPPLPPVPVDAPATVVAASSELQEHINSVNYAQQPGLVMMPTHPLGSASTSYSLQPRDAYAQQAYYAQQQAYEAQHQHAWAVYMHQYGYQQAMQVPHASHLHLPASHAALPTTAAMLHNAQHVLPVAAAQPEIIDISKLLLPPGHSQRPRRVLLVLRGLPGSGKSMVAKQIRELELQHGGTAPRIHALDDYFMTVRTLCLHDGNMH